MQKIVLITGASRGIGYEVATALAQKNHRVIAVARNKSNLQKLKKEAPDHIDFYTADLTSHEQLDTLNTYLSKEYEGIDVLINNAGALVNKPFSKLEKNDWQNMLDVNLLSVIDLTKMMLPMLTENSHIINISSMGGLQGSSKFPGLTAYSVAKGAVAILSECLAVELAESNIRVNALCLGSVQTEMFEDAFPGFEADVKPKKMGAYIANFALNGSNFYNGKILPVALNDPS